MPALLVCFQEMIQPGLGTFGAVLMTFSFGAHLCFLRSCSMPEGLIELNVRLPTIE